MNKIIDGKLLADTILAELKPKIINLDYTLAIIKIGNNEASNIYVNNKVKVAKTLNVKTKIISLSEDIKEREVIELIKTLNEDNNINGIILQAPLPNHINFLNCVREINTNLDVDALNDTNALNNYNNIGKILPCTVRGILYILSSYEINLSDKNVAVIGRSNLVGKPLFHALLNQNATVTLCHSKTVNLKEILLTKDIIISAVGKPNLITADMIKKGAIIIDVGITKENNKIMGDVDFKKVLKKSSLITKTPGGVGPLTVAMIFLNMYELNKERRR